MGAESGVKAAAPPRRQLLHIDHVRSYGNPSILSRDQHGTEYGIEVLQQHGMTCCATTRWSASCHRAPQSSWPWS
jgi:hypothetical protein